MGNNSIYNGGKIKLPFKQIETSICQKEGQMLSKSYFIKRPYFSQSVLMATFKMVKGLFALLALPLVCLEKCSDHQLFPIP